MTHIKKDRMIDCIKEFIGKFKEHYSGFVLISSVFIKENEEWKNCLSRMRFLGSHEEDAKARENIVYTDFALVEEIVSIDDAIKIMGNIEHGFSVGDFEITFPGTDGATLNFEHRGYESGNNDFSEYPGNLYVMGGHLQYQSMMRYPTVKYDVPCYKDGYHAIRDWISLSNFHDHSDGNLGKVMVFLPHFMARIKDLSFKDAKLCVEVEAKEDALKSLQCQVVFTYGKNEILQENQNFNGDFIVSFDATDQPDEVLIQLVTPENNKIDYYEETPFRHSGNKRFLRKVMDHNLLQKMQNGENERIEFKPFIKKADEKENEIIKTVVAFANTKGGSILFGVNDNCEPIGIKPKLLKNMRSSNFLVEYSKYLRKFISENLNKGVELELREHSVSGKKILEVYVTEGQKKPYFSIHTKECYIRKGASNRMPDPDTELHQLLEFPNSINSRKLRSQ